MTHHDTLHMAVNTFFGDDCESNCLNVDSVLLPINVRLCAFRDSRAAIHVPYMKSVLALTPRPERRNHPLSDTISVLGTISFLPDCKHTHATPKNDFRVVLTDFAVSCSRLDGAELSPVREFERWHSVCSCAPLHAREIPW